MHQSTVRGKIVIFFKVLHGSQGSSVYEENLSFHLHLMIIGTYLLRKGNHSKLVLLAQGLACVISTDCARAFTLLHWLDLLYGLYCFE